MPCEPTSSTKRRSGTGAVCSEEFLDRESLLNDWPFAGTADWVERVNTAQKTEAKIEALRKCVNRGTPYGTETWKTQIAATLRLKSTLQSRGRPKKQLELTSTRM